MIWTKQEIAHMACDAAEKATVPAALVCAIIEVSSSWSVGIREWEPESWLLMNHPNDFPGGEQEYIALGTRWGLMQFHGARLKNMNYPGKIDVALGEPKHNLEVGCWILKQLGEKHKDARAILIQWYGFERRRMADLTLALLPRFEQFVAARPVGKASAG
jgi:hypothetical protein